MPPLQNIGYFSVDERLGGVGSPWANNVRLATMFDASDRTQVWLKIFDPTQQTTGVYTFTATYADDVPVTTPDWTGPFPGSRYVIDYPGLPPTIPSQVFFSVQPDSTYNVYPIAFFTPRFRWQHAVPAERGPRLLLAPPPAYVSGLDRPASGKYSPGR